MGHTGYVGPPLEQRQQRRIEGLAEERHRAHGRESLPTQHTQERESASVTNNRIHTTVNHEPGVAPRVPAAEQPAARAAAADASASASWEGRRQPLWRPWPWLVRPAVPCSSWPSSRSAQRAAAANPRGCGNPVQGKRKQLNRNATPAISSNPRAQSTYLALAQRRAADASAEALAVLLTAPCLAVAALLML